MTLAVHDKPDSLATPSEPARSAPGGSPSAALVELRGITKRFYGTLANCEVDLDLMPGEVHAVLGENGAGKSTLCSVLAGLYRPDSGTVRIDGVEQRFRSPQDALAAGVGMVYQHYRLVDAFTVAENLALGHPELAALVGRRALEQRAHAVMERYGMVVDPSAYVGDLSVGEQQRVEILKLLSRGIRVLMLDEPTAVLTPQESQELFAAMRALAADGAAVVFVSHKLNEVLSVSDRITVLRDGCHVETVMAADTDRDALVRMMVDRDVAAAGPVDDEGVSQRALRRRATPLPVDGPCAARVRGLRVRGDRGEEALRDVDLDVPAGAIVGVAGVAGNGQRELAEAIAGMRPLAAGSVELGGNDVTRASTRERARRGIGYVPEDRLATGVAAALPLEQNLVLRSYWRKPYASGPFLSRRAMARTAAEQVERFDIRGVGAGLPVGILSGGNLQKAIIAREVDGDPQLVIAASPSRGLDVGATENVRALLARQRDRGAGVLLISEDLDELLELSDRLVVLYDGRVVGAMDAADADVERIGTLMTGAGGDA